MHAAPSGGPPPPEDAAPESPPPDNLPPDEPPPHLPPRRLGESVPELVGAGPLDHALARELALNPPDWLGVVVLTAEPSADHGADACAGPEDGYLPSAPLRRAVVAAHPTCVGPSCHVPSKECQLDHVIPWPIGRTEAANLRPLCLRCHLLKTHAGHRYAIEPTTGDIVWTTATGHRYRRTTTGVTTHLRRAGHVPPSPARRAGRP
ncbi:HNH endonuclease signature motif containing protein [Salana multivorans]